MLGTILLLLAVPIALWIATEVLARWSRAPWIWSLFGFSLERPRPTEPGDETGYRIGRPPDLPERLSLHDRTPLPAYDPGKTKPHRGDEIQA